MKKCFIATLALTLVLALAGCGNGNGGTIAGFAMSDGEPRGEHMWWGYKRIELREPGFLALRNDERGVPQVGQIGEITVISGGYEDE